jgi:hypothetical protein
MTREHDWKRERKSHTDRDVRKSTIEKEEHTKQRTKRKARGEGYQKKASIARGKKRSCCSRMRKSGSYESKRNVNYTSTVKAKTAEETAETEREEGEREDVERRRRDGHIC